MGHFEKKVDEQAAPKSDNPMCKQLVRRTFLLFVYMKVRVTRYLFITTIPSRL